MLSEPERRALEEIEFTLTTNDPMFAERLGNLRASRIKRRVKLVYDAVAVFSLLLGIGCIVLGTAGAGMVALCFAVVVVVARRMRFPTVAAKPVTRPGSPTGRS
jgi:hypothetical protein